MKFYLFVITALLTACSSSSDAQIAVLQKKLEVAQRDQIRAREEVGKIHKEIVRSQISFVRKQIDEVEKLIKNSGIAQLASASLFIKEREMLHRLVQNGSLEAQVELDRILRIITELGNQPK